MNNKIKNGMAIIMAMLIVSIAVSIATYLLNKQSLLIQKVSTQNNLQNIQSLSLGAMAWAKIALAGDNNSVDYLQEINILNINHLNISDVLHNEANLNNDENIYLSAKMQDAQSKFNINNIINWSEDSFTNIRLPISINRINFEFFQKLLTKLNINPQLAWQTVYYIFASYNKNFHGEIVNNISPPLSNIKKNNVITLSKIDDLFYIGFNLEEIDKLKLYTNIINETTKINVNTADKFILSTLFDNIGDSADFFYKNPNLYANNIIQALNYLKVDIYKSEEIVNIANQILDVQTKFIDIYATIEQNNYKYDFFARFNKQNKKFEQFIKF